MKKLLVFMIIGFLIINVPFVLGSSDNKNKYIIIDLSFSNPVIEDTGDYVRIDLEGANSEFLIEGFYMLPIYQHKIFLPFGSKIIDIDYKINNFYNQITKRKLKINSHPKIMYQLDSDKKVSVSTELNVKNLWFEYNVGTVLHNNMRQLILELIIYPVRYHPDEDYFEWFENAEILIEYEEPKNINFFNDEYNLLILCPSDFSDELEDLVGHKNNIGVLTKVVTLDEIYDGDFFPVEGRDDQEKIKYFIKNSIEQWDVKNVLLVGGEDMFPTRRAHINLDDWDDGSFVSDLYYADIYDSETKFSSWDTNENDIFAESGFSGPDDEVDLYPDIKLGRLACTSYNEVTTCVNKIITYEKNKAYTKDWFSDILGVGGDTHIGDLEEIDEGEYINDMIFDIMNGFTPIHLYASNGGLSGFIPSGKENINNKINDGCGFINFLGHGATWGYGTHPHNDQNTWLPTPDGYYLTTDVNNLNNNNKLPIIMTSGCDVSKFYEDSNCYSWAFVSNPNGGGIASFGASAVSYGGGGTDSAETRIGKMIINMYDAFKNQNVKTLGDMWITAIIDYINPSMSNIDYKVVESWQAFGDPTLIIAEESNPPIKPKPPEGLTSGNINEEYTYTAFTTDPDFDQIFYKFDWGDGTYSEWIGPVESGETIEGKHIWTETNSNLKLRVTAKDTHGYISEWSDPLSISMPRNKIIQTKFLNYLKQCPQLFQLLQLFFNL